MPATDTPEKPESKESVPSDKKPAPTPEELENLAKESMAEFFSNERLEKKTKKKGFSFPGDKPVAEEEPKPEPAKDDEPKDEIAGKPKEEKPKPEPPAKEQKPAQDAPKEEKPAETPKPRKTPPKSILEEDEIEAIAQRVVDKAKPEPEKKKETDPFEGLSEDEREELAPFAYLEKTDKYKGRALVKEVREFWRKEPEYIAAWQKEHPGETFDVDDEAHAGFYNANEPKVSESDLKKAERQMIVDEAEKKAETKAESRLKKMEAEQRRKEVIESTMPKIQEATYRAVGELIASVPDFKAIVGEERLLPVATIEKLKETDPVAFEAVDQEAEALRVRVEELESMMQLGNHFEFDEKKVHYTKDGQTVLPHAEIIDTAQKLEQNILKQTEDEQIVDGRRFITRAERGRRLQQIWETHASNDEKRDRVTALDRRFWVIQPDDIKAVFIEKSSRRVNKVIELAEKRHQHHLSKNGKKPETEPKPDPDKKADKPAPKAPPSTSSASDTVNSRIPGSSREAETIQNLVKDWF